MKDIRFEWDLCKARSNLRKHGVSFEEAATAFNDELAIEWDDIDHSQREDRFLLLGMSVFRVVVVCYCYRKAGSVIRIISARKADRFEISHYQKGIS